MNILSTNGIVASVRHRLDRARGRCSPTSTSTGAPNYPDDTMTLTGT